MTASTPLVVLYRWRLHAGMEDAFASAWRDATIALLARGSCGSRLHRGDDGLWYGYAQWPDAQARSLAFSDPGINPSFVARMQACVEERLPDILLTPMADLLRPLPSSIGE